MNLQIKSKDVRFKSGLKLDVHSIFPTIQGEGNLTGMPSVFIRLYGCNLQCTFCDTDYTSKNTKLSIDEIVSTCKGYNYDHIVITGGEPFRQNILPLVEELLFIGKSISIETNGTIYNHDTYSEICKHINIVYSPKLKVNRILLEDCRCIKIIINKNTKITEDDILKGSSLGYSTEIDLKLLPKNKVWLQPQDDLEYQQNLKKTLDLCFKYGYNISLQTHKIMEVE